MMSKTDIANLITRIDNGSYDIDDILNDVATAEKGVDVRAAIYALWYIASNNGKYGTIDTQARAQIANLLTTNYGSGYESDRGNLSYTTTKACLRTIAATMSANKNYMAIALCPDATWLCLSTSETNYRNYSIGAGVSMVVAPITGVENLYLWGQAASVGDAWTDIYVIDMDNTDITDMKVAYDGSTYDTAAASVRGQASALDAAITEVASLEEYELPLTWEAGSIVASTGKDNDEAKAGWSRTATRIPASLLKNGTLSVTFNAGDGDYDYYGYIECYYINPDESGNSAGRLGPILKGNKYTIDSSLFSNIKYIRLIQKANIDYVNVSVKCISHVAEKIADISKEKYLDFENVYVLNYAETTPFNLITTGTTLKQSGMGTALMKCPEWLGFIAPDENYDPETASGDMAVLSLYIGHLNDSGTFENDYIFSTSSSIYNNKITWSRIIHIPARTDGKEQYFYYQKTKGDYTIIACDEMTSDLDDLSLSPFSASLVDGHLIPGEAVMIPAGCDYIISTGLTSDNAGKTDSDIANVYVPSKTKRNWFDKLDISSAGHIPEDAEFGFIRFSNNLHYENVEIYVRKPDVRHSRAGLGQKAHDKAIMLANVSWTPTEPTLVYWQDGTNTFSSRYNYHGIPYSSRWINSHYVGFEVSLFTMLSAIADQYSVMWNTDPTITETGLLSEGEGKYGNGPGYGLVCTSFTSLLMGCPYPQSGKGFMFDSNFVISGDTNLTPGNVYLSHTDGHCIYADEAYDNGYAIYEQRKPITAKTTHTGNDDEYDTLLKQTGRDYCNNYEMNITCRDRSLIKNPLLDEPASPTNGDVRPWRGNKSVYGPWDAASRKILLTLHQENGTFDKVELYTATVTKDDDGNDVITTGELVKEYTIETDKTTLDVTKEVVDKGSGTYAVCSNVHKEVYEVFRYYSHGDIYLRFDEDGMAYFADAATDGNTYSDVMYVYATCRGYGIEEYDWPHSRPNTDGLGSMVIAAGHYYPKLLNYSYTDPDTGKVENRIHSVHGAIIADPDSDCWGRYTAPCTYNDTASTTEDNNTGGD